jgi:hypothetical protein
MALDRTWYNTLVNDDSSNTVGTLWDKAAVDSLMDAIDAALALLLPLAGGTVTGTTTFSSGTLTLSGMPDATAGLKLQAVTTGRPTIEFRNVTTGALAQFVATNTKDIQLSTNAGSNYAITAYANGGIYLGGPSPADPGANAVATAGTLKIGSRPAFAAGDKYLIVDASGNVHVSGLGPAS